MNRRTLIAGNWKLNKTVTEALTLVSDLRRLLSQVRDCDLVIAPPFTAIWPAVHRLEGSNIQLAGQDLYFEDQGAFTGTVSGPMLKDAGCQYVLVGHSERRQFFGETLDSARRRVRAALRSGLTPILCIGETLAERQAEQTFDIVQSQLLSAIEELPTADLRRLVIAYEPVWAIGTGQVATPEQAQEVHQFIRECLRKVDAEAAKSVRILYGGSVKPDNAAELLGKPDIDGALVGGASLDAETFANIVKARPR